MPQIRCVGGGSGWVPEAFWDDLEVFMPLDQAQQPMEHYIGIIRSCGYAFFSDSLRFFLFLFLLFIVVMLR